MSAQGSYQKKPLKERFMAKVDQNGPLSEVLGTRCWIWKGHIGKHGYGLFSMTKTTPIGCHRASLHLLRDAPIVPGRKTQIDHLCRNRACVNPDHLELVTAVVNNKRMRAANPDFAARQRGDRKAACPKGHPYTDDNTYTRTRSGSTARSRHCRACHAAHEQRRRDRRRANAPQIETAQGGLS